MTLRWLRDGEGDVAAKPKGTSHWGRGMSDGRQRLGREEEEQRLATQRGVSPHSQGSVLSPGSEPNPPAPYKPSFPQLPHTSVHGTGARRSRSGRVQGAEKRPAGQQPPLG